MVQFPIDPPPQPQNRRDTLQQHSEQISHSKRTISRFILEPNHLHIYPDLCCVLLKWCQRWFLWNRVRQMILSLLLATCWYSLLFIHNTHVKNRLKNTLFIKVNVIVLLSSKGLGDSIRCDQMQHEKLLKWTSTSFSVTLEFTLQNNNTSIQVTSNYINNLSFVHGNFCFKFDRKRCNAWKSFKNVTQ